MKKLLTALVFVAMLTAGTGVVGASDTTQKDTQLTVQDSSFSTMNKKPIVMD
ncbi:hypothetical protein [Salipaludibacillus keqinensis]|uniref:hypothetical protein n=1 Tax=Salipaludibacillus keqinensis TaxID=2045207 RepID=UPI0013048074|nr:hypothetical protein [Salipaludibacillus keqinensis]